MNEDDKEIKKKYEAFRVSLLAQFKEHFPEAIISFPEVDPIKKIEETARDTFKEIVEENKAEFTAIDETFKKIAEEKAKKEAEDKAKAEAEAKAKELEEIYRKMEQLKAKAEKINKKSI